MTPDGVVSTYAGTGVHGYTGDGGPATQAQIELDGKMAVNATGTLYFTDGVDYVIRRITPDGMIATYAGNGQPAAAPDEWEQRPSYQGGVRTCPGRFDDRHRWESLRCRDYTNQIRKITPDGTIVASPIEILGFMDGPAMSAQFYTPYGLTVDASGNVFVADVNNGVVRKISSGIVSTVAGTPVFSFSGDGGPALFHIPFPARRHDRRNGNLYIEDTGNFRIRVVTAGWTIRSVAGNGQFESTRDGTPAASSSLVGPNFLSFDPSGRLLIADGGDYTVRRINSDGTIQTIAELELKVRETDTYSLMANQATKL